MLSNGCAEEEGVAATLLAKGEDSVVGGSTGNAVRGVSTGTAFLAAFAAGVEAASPLAVALDRAVRVLAVATPGAAPTADLGGVFFVFFLSLSASVAEGMPAPKDLLRALGGDDCHAMRCDARGIQG